MFYDSICDKIFVDVKVVLIVEMEIDDCDSMLDYFNVKIGCIIILGFLVYMWNNFKEMCKVVLNNEEIVFFVGVDIDVEYCENYSMGVGYYFKDGYCYLIGWVIKKCILLLYGNDIVKLILYGEWLVFVVL